ncbi:heme exporter protein CcmD [Mesorhizobium sp.]|uniref:heme exporter protein CcmD n=1 Tax=Mesorhizobium sp. TaxID=1871066 RepID=UPI000FEA7ABE|nr:heme exporter protein CcmD [Mesorhizobium sp.]RWH35932.1 MAG: heme exporter protein CcmD [Mesorhizobium sp.]
MSAHALYVAAAYAISAIVLVGLIGWILLDRRARKRELAALDAAGVRRRSDKAGTNLPPLGGSNLPGLDSRSFAGKVTLVNVFASWCAPCREEHPVLLALSQDKRFTLAALNYKDEPANARRFLGDLGNPYQAIGVDPAGRAAIDWGVYGVPETFVIGKDGKIAYKHVGPLTPESAKDLLLPQIEKALAVSG